MRTTKPRGVCGSAAHRAARRRARHRGHHRRHGRRLSRASRIQRCCAGSIVASSLFGSAGLKGQVNYLTTKLLPSSGPGTGFDAPRGVALASVGAPVGTVGDWTVRGAFNAGGLSSWMLHGEYRSRETQTHVLTLGMSHSAQVLTNRTGTLTTPVQSRSVGKMYAFDRWRANRLLEIDYGLRFDRYDYLTTGALLSPRTGVAHGSRAANLRGRIGIVDTASPLAPRSFCRPRPRSLAAAAAHVSSLGGAPLSAESIETYQVGLDQQSDPVIASARCRSVASGSSPTTRWRPSSGSKSKATRTTTFVATAADMGDDGWSISISETFHRARSVARCPASLAQRASMHPVRGRAALRRAAPLGDRDGRRSVRDLTTAVSRPPSSLDRVTVYRMDSAFQSDPSRGPSSRVSIDSSTSSSVRPYRDAAPRRATGGSCFAIHDLYNAHEHTFNVRRVPDRRDH